jgi:hypothetical protein
LKDLIETSCKRNYWVFQSSVDNKWPKQIHIMFNQNSWAMLLFPFVNSSTKCYPTFFHQTRFQEDFKILNSRISFPRRFQYFRFKLNWIYFIIKIWTSVIFFERKRKRKRRNSIIRGTNCLNQTFFLFYLFYLLFIDSSSPKFFFQETDVWFLRSSF